MLRIGLLGGATVTVSCFVGWLAVPGAADLLTALRRDPGATATWRLDRLLGDVAAAGCLVSAAALVVLFVLSMCAVATATTRPEVAARCARWTPAGYRRVVLALCGLGVAGPLAGGTAAFAAGPSAPCHIGCVRAGAPRLGGLALPELPATVPSARYAQTRLLVRPGDSLWLLASAQLPATASDADIAAFTTRLYDLNRHVIGPDPDLILPGMSLLAPEVRP